MKRMLLKGLFGLIFWCSVMTGFFFVSEMDAFAVSEETQNAIDEAEDEKDRLEETLQEQEEEKEILEQEKEGQEQKLHSLRQQAWAISENLESLQAEVEMKEQEIAEKEDALEEMIKNHEKQYAAMKLRIQYAYETPKESFFGLLLKQLPFAKILNRVDQALQIQEYDREQLESYKRAAEQIQEQKQMLEEAHQELQVMLDNEKAMQAKVATLQQQTRDSISAYLNQISLAEEDIDSTEAALEEKSEALKALYAKAQAEEEAERQRQAAEAAAKLQNAISSGAIKPEDSGIVYGELNLTQNEMDMLTAMIYCESRGEPYEGQLAVGHVIINRVRSTKFPNDLEAVLRQNKQFEPAGSGRFDIVLTAYWQNIPGVIGQAEWESCKKAAYACVNGESNVGECLFFRTHAPVPQLAENLKAAGVPYWIIGNHIFYYSWVNY